MTIRPTTNLLRSSRQLVCKAKMSCTLLRSSSPCWTTITIATTTTTKIKNNNNSNNNSCVNNISKPMIDPSPGIIVVTVSLSSSSLEPMRRLTGLGPFEDNDEEIFFSHSARTDANYQQIDGGVTLWGYSMMRKCYFSYSSRKDAHYWRSIDVLPLFSRITSWQAMRLSCQKLGPPISAFGAAKKTRKVISPTCKSDVECQSMRM